VIPPELNNGIKLTIVDSFIRRDHENEAIIVDEIMQADAVIAMYDISQPNTVERLGVYWIPLINQHS